jgi:lysozyme
VAAPTNLRSLLSLHEGRVAHAYSDSLGFLTIGVGHLIDAKKGGKLPEHIIDALLDHDISTHAAELVAALPWVSKLPSVRYCVLVDMAFNMGVPKLLQFVMTLKAVREGRYTDAAKEMLNSNWAKQVGRRAARLAAMMETGAWPLS